MTSSRLILTRPQILTFRRASAPSTSGSPSGASSLQRAAWAGLQDSMPRAALLSIHARIVSTQNALAPCFMPSGWVTAECHSMNQVPPFERTAKRSRSTIGGGSVVIVDACPRHHALELCP